jgi:hypothetical protein
MKAARRVVGASTALAAILGAPLLVSSAAGSTVTGGTLAVSRTSGMPGESLTVTVTDLPGAAARAARLERCVAYTDGSWTTCTYWVEVATITTADHAATFNTRVHAMQRNRYRVVAPGSSTTATVITPNKPVDGLQQEATISLPRTTTAGSTAKVWIGPGTGPVRAGRGLALQQRNADGSWTQVGDVVPASSTGKAIIYLPLPTAGTWTYRAVAQTWAPAGQDTRVGWFPSFPATVVVS